MIIVQGCDFLYTGDGIHRMHAPAKALGELDGVLSIDCHVFHPSFLPLALRADVLVLPFLREWDMLHLIRERRKYGRITILEMDDYYHEPEPWNPMAASWASASVREEHIATLENANGVQTSTESLKELWAHKNQNIAVFKNHLVKVQPLKSSSKKTFTIGWAGSQGHLADWYTLAKKLEPWLQEHPEVKFALMSHERARDFLNIPDEQLIYQSAGTLEEYLQFLPEMDIGFAPLCNTTWNRSRSDVKFLEYASTGVVGIYSDIGPYNNSVQNNETGFLVSDTDGMIERLNALYKNRASLQVIREKAHRYVREERILGDHIPERINFYRSLGAQDGDPKQIEPFIPAGTVKEKGYLRIDRDAVTQVIYDHFEGKRRLEDGSLQQELNKTPQYYFGHRYFGELLRRGGNIQGAHGVFSHAHSLFPADPKLLFEQGICLFQLGRGNEALQHICQALSMNPHRDEWWQVGASLALRLGKGAAQALLELYDSDGQNYLVHGILLPLRRKEELNAQIQTLFELLKREKFRTLMEREKTRSTKLLGRILLSQLPRLSDEEERGRLFKRALSFFPNHLPLLTAYMSHVLKMGFQDEVIKTQKKIKRVKGVLEANGYEAALSDIDYYLDEIVSGG